MTTLFQDLRFLLRQWRKSPAFALTAMLTLAFGIGATTAIFSLVEGVLLRPLPFHDPRQLVTLSDAVQGVGERVIGTTAPGTVTYAREAQGFSALGAYRQASYEFSGTDEPAQINASRLSAAIFPVLGVPPLLGRVFTRSDDEGHQPVTVLSYSMWHGRFHADPGILGRKILLDRKPYEVIGVMPRAFEFPLVPGQLGLSELWVPISFTAADLGINGSGSWNYHMVGRLQPGITPARAEESAQRVAAEIMRTFPPAMNSLRIQAEVRPLAEETVAESRPLVQTLFVAVSVVLLIACANLAGLLLVRVIRRRREIAVRLALGASGVAVLRQGLLETLLLSCMGGLLGLIFAATLLRTGKAFLPETLPRISAIGLDWRVGIFALGLAVLTGLLCGLIPAIAAARTDVNGNLKEGRRTGTAGASHAHLRSALVIAELAVALVLLISSGLLLRSFQQMRSVDLGFRTDHVLTASFSLPSQQYAGQAAVDSFTTRLLTQLGSMPAVQAVGITSQLPSAGRGDSGSFVPEGYVPKAGTGLISTWPSQISGNYFTAAGISLLRGRTFHDEDRAGSPLVVIINRTLAEHYWPGEDPVGKRLHWGLPETPLPWMTVVGEIGNIKDFAADSPTRNQIYQPITQAIPSFGQFAPAGSRSGDFGTIVLRSALPPDQMTDALRQAVRSIDPQLPLTLVESLDKVVEEGQASRRFNAILLSGFAAAAVLLAVLGIYSVTSFSATMRTQEMAIRLALGSGRSGIVRLILRSGARMGIAGCFIGAVASFFTTRLLRSLLFQVSPLDPLVTALATAAIFLLALAATLLPGLRIAAIEPVAALRAE